MSKVIWDRTGFALLRSVIGPENCHQSFNQSDAKEKATMTWTPAFSRALGNLVGLTLSSDWLLKIFFFLLVGRCDCFAFALTFGSFIIMLTFMIAVKVAGLFSFDSFLIIITCNQQSSCEVEVNIRHFRKH